MHRWKHWSGFHSCSSRLLLATLQTYRRILLGCNNLSGETCTTLYLSLRSVFWYLYYRVVELRASCCHALPCMRCCLCTDLLPEIKPVVTFSFCLKPISHSGLAEKILEKFEKWCVWVNAHQQIVLKRRSVFLAASHWPGCIRLALSSKSSYCAWKSRPTARGAVGVGSLAGERPCKWRPLLLQSLGMWPTFDVPHLDMFPRSVLCNIQTPRQIDERLWICQCFTYWKNVFCDLPYICIYVCICIYIYMHINIYGSSYIHACHAYMWINTELTELVLSARHPHSSLNMSNKHQGFDFT